VPASEKLAYVFRVVAFVETDVLTAAARGLRALDRNAVKGRLKKFDVMRVGSAHLNAQRHAVSIGEHRSLGSQFTAIGRVFPSFFPHPEAIWSSLRPRFANSTESLFVGRTPKARPSTTCGRRPPRSILGSNDATYSPNHTRSALLSIDSLCVIRRKCRWQSFASRHAVDHLDDSFDSEAKMAPSAARVGWEESRNAVSVFSPLETPPCKYKKSDESLSVRG